MWRLTSLGDYSVASAHALVDDYCPLSSHGATLWVRLTPITVTIFVWLLSNDILVA